MLRKLVEITREFAGLCVSLAAWFIIWGRFCRAWSTSLEVGIYGTNRSKLTEPAFPPLFFGSVTCFPLSSPELETTINLFLEPIEVVCELIFTKHWIILLVFISAWKQTTWCYKTSCLKEMFKVELWTATCRSQTSKNAITNCC